MPADPALAVLDATSLVNRLPEEAVAGIGLRRASPSEQFLALRLADQSDSESPVLTEIVRRGLLIVPTLLEHLSDGRPTRISLDPADLSFNGTSGPFTDVYDYRYHQDGTRPSAVNSSKDKAPTGQWPYTVRVGDLCYVALGQIVNRRYYVVGPDFGNGIAYDGVILLEINSPVERPALAAAARADWGHLTAQDFAAELRNEAEHEIPSTEAPDDRPEDFQPAVSWTGAIERLLYYFPDAGGRVVEAMLSQPAAEFGPGASAESVVLVQRNAREKLLQTLDSFDWTTLHPVLWDYFQSAADEEREMLLNKGANERLGTDLPLALAGRLVHLGHDKELEAFFSDAVARMIREYPQAMAEQEREMTGAPTDLPGATLGSVSDSESLRRNYMLETAHVLLRDPIQARIALLHKLGVDRFSVPPDP